MPKEFRLLPGGIQDQFLASRTKIQIFGGAFGNGKSTAMVMKALTLARDYPGSTGLMARSTYPKLNDTLRKTFIEWCPKKWIKSFPLSVNASNICTMDNATEIFFRYIAQQGKNEEASTSNLLSATYDWIVVDQAEDPEITYKDFLDLLGRLRGSTPYRGNDPSMPRTGPRWMLLGVNPTRNWVWQKLVKPYKDYTERGIISKDLLCIRDQEGNPKLDENGKAILLIELVEGSTYDNAHNLPEDFISTQESAYTGQMRDRFLHGKWAAYEGLVYPQYDRSVHMVDEAWIRKYIRELSDYDLKWREAYDYGLAAPSCYFLSFTDPLGNVIVVDGYYKKEFPLEDKDDKTGQYTEIRKLREAWQADIDDFMYADPAIFRRAADGKTGVVISQMMHDNGILVQRAQNDILSGITKVGGYLNFRRGWINPFTLETPAPSLYYNAKLDFVETEFSGYFWKKGKDGERLDEPQDVNDHAMDTSKYLLTNLPAASELKGILPNTLPAWMSWQENEMDERKGSRRHG